MSKPKVGFFDFTSCEGCQIELTNYGDSAFLALLDLIDIVEFREAMTETAGNLDIAFIEGSFSREEDRKRLESIRKRSAVVIAYGACAATGGINALKNHQPDYAKYVYGDKSNMPHLASQDAVPISAAIKVDYFVHGCPMDRNELLRIVSDILHGSKPVIPDYPVCVECKRRETVCRYLQGDHCMGVVARAGCNAICPAHGIPCEACRGFVTHANEESLKKTMVVRGGLTFDRAANKSRMFTATFRNEGNGSENL